MPVSIRLSRGGAKKRPYYKIVVATSRSPRDGKYLEQVGTYNPLLSKDDEKRVRLVEDRVKYWLGVGAQPTDRVARMLDKAGIKERKSRENPQKAQPSEKAFERSERRRQHEAAMTLPAPPDENFEIKVYLDLDNEEEFMKLYASAQKFMSFLGYTSEVELVSD